MGVVVQKIHDILLDHPQVVFPLPLQHRDCLRGIDLDLVLQPQLVVHAHVGLAWTWVEDITVVTTVGDVEHVAHCPPSAVQFDVLG